MCAAKDLVKAKTRSSRMGDLASKFAAKIQLLNESQEDFDVMLRYVPSGVIIRNGLIRNEILSSKLVELI